MPVRDDPLRNRAGINERKLQVNLLYMTLGTN